VQPIATWSKWLSKLSVYSGFPAALNAAGRARNVLEAQERPGAGVEKRSDPTTHDEKRFLQGAATLAATSFAGLTNLTGASLSGSSAVMGGICFIEPTMEQIMFSDAAVTFIRTVPGEGATLGSLLEKILSAAFAISPLTWRNRLATQMRISLTAEG
jgi:hypothetical protein